MPSIGVCLLHTSRRHIWSSDREDVGLGRPKALQGVGAMLKARPRAPPGVDRRAFQTESFKAGSGRVGRSRRSGRGARGPAPPRAPPRPGGRGRARLAPRDARSGAFRGSGEGGLALDAGSSSSDAGGGARRSRARGGPFEGPAGGRGRVQKCGKNQTRADGGGGARAAHLSVSAPPLRTSPMACCSSLASNGGGARAAMVAPPTGASPREAARHQSGSPPSGWARADRERAPRAMLRRFGAATPPTSRERARGVRPRRRERARPREPRPPPRERRRRHERARTAPARCRLKNTRTRRARARAPVPSFFPERDARASPRSLVERTRAGVRTRADSGGVRRGGGRDRPARTFVRSERRRGERARAGAEAEFQGRASSKVQTRGRSPSDETNPRRAISR